MSVPARGAAALLLALALTACASIHLGGQERLAVSFAEVDRFARLARLAYQPDSAILAAAADSYRVVIRELPATGGRYFLLTSDRDSTHVVSVRGTSDLKNVLEDAEYLPSFDRRLGVWLHRGFEHATHDVYRDLLPRLQPGYRVQLTGHSLGGAIAAILLMHLNADAYRVPRVVTFGQPKVTNEAGVRAYAHVPLLRVIDCRDPIPLLPPLDLLSVIHGPYRHFGPEVILLDDSLYIALAEHAAERFPVTSFWLNLGRLNLKDHYMVNYLARVEEKLDAAVEIPYRDRNRHPCVPIPPPTPAPPGPDRGGAASPTERALLVPVGGKR